jgi:hypothetical protein
MYAHTSVKPITPSQAFIIILAKLSLLPNMASMGFSYAQIHVRKERVCRRICEEAAATTTMNKSMTKEENKKKSFTAEEEKAVRDSQTARRVHPCTASTAMAASSPMGGHR